MLAIVIAVAVIGLVVWLATRARRSAGMNSAESQLRRMLDAEAAERLIKWEMIRDPNLSRADAARKALERAEYDRGR